jgi:hypothetical protein
MTTTAQSLSPRPPLPSPLEHDQIKFIFDPSLASATPSGELIAAIALGLSMVLPPEGDLRVDASGAVHVVSNQNRTSQPPSLWYQAGLLVGIERNQL